MGTWGVGPFDSDATQDFADKLDGADPDDREAIIRGVLTRTADTVGYPMEAPDAVAAAALIAAQCPGGMTLEPDEGPEHPMPVFADDLRPLAVEALDRILSPEFRMVASFVSPDDGAQWLAIVKRLRAVLVS